MITLIAAALALMTAPLPLRWLTAALAGLGVMVVALGMLATGGGRPKDRVWFAVGGVLNALVLLLALVFPGLLNAWWVLDTPVAPIDPNAQVAVLRDRPLDEGKIMSPEDWAEADKEGVRQGNVFVRLESVKVGPLTGLPDPAYLLVHLRLEACRGETITLEGFGSDKPPPALTGDGGHSYAFREARPRKPARGSVPVFDASAPQGAVIGPGAPGPLPSPIQEYLLVFASPPARFASLKLEVPAAWGGQGACRFRLSGLFDLVPRKP
jgi:hypothetical protein